MSIVAPVKRAAQRIQPFDVAVAAVVLMFGQQEAWAPAAGFASPVGPRPVLALTYLVTALALVWRRRAPLAVVVVVTAVLTAHFVAFGAPDGLGVFLPLLISFFAAGRHGERRRFALVVGLITVAMAVHELRDPEFTFEGPTVMYWAILAASGFLGLAFNTRARQVQTMQARAARLEAEHEERARAAAAAERSRIARELHDIVGHGVSLMVLQLVAAQGMLEAGQVEPTRHRLAGLERTARSTLSEMRRLVAVIDASEDEVPQLSPQPGLADVPQLIEQVRAAGTDVELVMETAPIDVPAGLGLAVYRFVQESLTNVVKHAVAATGVFVRIGAVPDSLTVEVTDDGRGPVGDLRGGRGITGMRERVALYSGTLDIGPRPEGGFRARACFPLGESIA